MFSCGMQRSSDLFESARIQLIKARRRDLMDMDGDAANEQRSLCPVFLKTEFNVRRQ